MQSALETFKQPNPPVIIWRQFERIPGAAVTINRTIRRNNTADVLNLKIASIVF